MRVKLPKKLATANSPLKCKLGSGAEVNMFLENKYETALEQRIRWLYVLKTDFYLLMNPGRSSASKEIFVCIEIVPATNI